jgi:uncharacterized RDD family membrane protein YckC
MAQVYLSQRCAALAIDLLVAAIPSYNLWLLAQAQHWTVLQPIAILLFITLVLLRDSLFVEQSIGKRIMMYQIVRKDHTALRHNYRISLLRNLSLFLLPLDIIRLWKGRQRLGDKWAGTRLVQQAGHANFKRITS